jgi:pyridoxal phosphate enzyme (YggS family)
MAGGVTDVVANLRDVQARIDDAITRSGRRPSDVTLVAVTKTVHPNVVRLVLEAGVRDLGENRAQELLTKVEPLAGLEPRWHFVGRLQRNKVRALAPHVHCWQSVDRDELARTIAQHAPGARVFVEVNTGDEPQKGGCSPTDTPALVGAARDLGLRVDGLMTVPPIGTDPRPHFDALAELASRVGVPGLSMGMTGDFDVAIEHGATVVRVGRAIFGPRPNRDGMER